MTLDNRSLLVCQVLLSLLAWGAVARGLAWPALMQMERHRAIRWLLVPQMFRHVGMSLLATGVTGPGMPDEFASWVATGDLITAVLAITAFVLLGRPRTRGLGTAVAAVATVVGAADLVHNSVLGMRMGTAYHLGSAWLIVAVLVPGMLVAHALAARTLLRRG